MKSVLITQLPENHSMLITEQVFLFDYPDNLNNLAILKYSGVADFNYSTAEKRSNKKKLKQVASENG